MVVKRFLFSFLIVSFSFVFFVEAALVGFLKWNLYQTEERAALAKTNFLFLKQENELRLLQRDFDQLKASLSASVAKVEKESQRAIDEKINEFSKSNIFNVPSIIKEWRARLAAVECLFQTDVVQLKTRGSGLLVKRNGNFTLLTNKHLVFYNEEILADSCTIKLPDDSETIMTVAANGDFRYTPDQLDAGFIIIRKPTAYMKKRTGQFSQLAVCKEPVVGDEMVILGYPLIGTKTDITATNGIISGFDGDYYITSAKVERGNSGGAAILLKKNCYLGIPTFVQQGQLESLARILKAQAILSN